MKDENIFKLDLEAEKSSLDSIIESQRAPDPLLQPTFEPIKYNAQDIAKIEKFAGFSEQIEMMQPMSGKLSPVLYNYSPIQEPSSSQRELLYQQSAQADLMKKMNTLGNAINEIAGQVQRKQDIISNSDSVTESRTSIQQRNLMFVDRSARAIKRPSWA